MNIYQKLMLVQSELKSPKGQYNDHSHFYYRSCEDILESVKPILKKYNMVLILTDDITVRDGRYYVCAKATLIDIENANADGNVCTVTNTAFAREAETRKGMDESQITGTASSYARKYALNGLFCIDDTKDADTNEFREQIERGKNKSDNGAPPPPQQQDVTMADLVCSNCNADIKLNVFNFSKQKFGRPLCFNCQKNAKQN